MDESGKSAWCRERGGYPQDLEQWHEVAIQTLAEPEDDRASPGETKADRRRIKERELRRKGSAAAKTAALLVLSCTSSGAMFDASTSKDKAACGQRFCFMMP